MKVNNKNVKMRYNKRVDCWTIKINGQKLIISGTDDPQMALKVALTPDNY